jgi:hypothetical protein
MTGYAKHLLSVVALIAFGVMAVASDSKKTGGEGTAPPPPAAQPPGPTAPPTAVTPVAAKAAPTGYDELGVEKPWGNMSVSLKSFSIRGKTAFGELLIKNPQDKEETVSSLMQFEVMTPDGDKGEMDIMATKCDGAVPPKGQMKCKLAYKFESAPKEVQFRVGAGVLSEAVYFKPKSK